MTVPSVNSAHYPSPEEVEKDMFATQPSELELIDFKKLVFQTDPEGEVFPSFLKHNSWEEWQTQAENWPRKFSPIILSSELQEYGSYVQAVKKQYEKNAELIDCLFYTVKEKFWPPTIKTSGEIEIIDVEIPWHRNLFPFLNSEIQKKEDIPEAENFFDGLSMNVFGMGFIEVRRERQKIIEKIKTDATIKKFYIYSSETLVAKKEGGQFQVLHKELYDELLRIPTENEIRRDFEFLRLKFFQKVEEMSLSADEDLTSLDPATLNSLMRQIQAYRLELYNEEVSSLVAPLMLFYDMVESTLINQNSQIKLPSEVRRLKLFEPSAECTRYLSSILEYMNGKCDEDKLGINADNAGHFLNLIKCIDLSLMILQGSEREIGFPKSSDTLRTYIVEKYPLTTSEAYTVTLDHNKMSDSKYLQQEKGWVPSRRALHESLIAKFLPHTETLSVWLPRIVGLRGNSGSGKSTLIKQLQDEFKLENMEGVMNPDAIKYILKMHILLNTQVQDEGSAVFKMFLELVIKKIDLKYILDTRLLYLDTVEANLLRPAQARAVPVIIYDLDVPLITSLNRILIRKPHGKDPCVAFDPIKEGFILARKERPKIIERLCQVDAEDADYSLIVRGKPIATIKKGQLQIFDQEAYKECIREPEEEEIKQITSQVIDDRYIAEAIARKDIRQEDEHMLKKWYGFCLEKAVSEHAMENKMAELSEPTGLIEEFKSLHGLERLGGRGVPPNEEPISIERKEAALKSQLEAKLAEMNEQIGRQIQRLKERVKKVDMPEEPKSTAPNIETDREKIARLLKEIEGKEALINKLTSRIEEMEERKKELKLYES